MVAGPRSRHPIQCMVHVCSMWMDVWMKLNIHRYVLGHIHVDMHGHSATVPGIELWCW